jgi:CheY-like chemotaxis protein
MAISPATRILVVDDEPLIRLDARDILEDAGYLIFEASTADEAMQLLAQTDVVDAILTDIEMPGSMDGLELAHTVDCLIPTIALVIMSGRRLPQRTDMPLKAAFLSKPFTPSILLQRVAEALVKT